MFNDLFSTPAARRAQAALEELAAKRKRQKPTPREAFHIILNLDDRLPKISLAAAKKVAREALEENYDEKIPDHHN